VSASVGARKMTSPSSLCVGAGSRSRSSNRLGNHTTRGLTASHWQTGKLQFPHHHHVQPAHALGGIQNSTVVFVCTDQLQHILVSNFCRCFPMRSIEQRTTVQYSTAVGAREMKDSRQKLWRRRRRKRKSSDGVLLKGRRCYRWVAGEIAVM
jgi:hypothetical protein